MTEKTLRRVYWTATLLFFVPQLYNAVQMLGGAPHITSAITKLGYPLYFVKALAVAKLLGAVAIFYDRSRTLKEWAYAGYTFEVLAAFVSEWAVEGAPLVAMIVLLFLGLLLMSYACWKRMSTRLEAFALPRHVDLTLLRHIPLLRPPIHRFVRRVLPPHVRTSTVRATPNEPAPRRPRDAGL